MRIPWLCARARGTPAGPACRSPSVSEVCNDKKCQVFFKRSLTVQRTGWASCYLLRTSFRSLPTPNTSISKEPNQLIWWIIQFDYDDYSWQLLWQQQRRAESFSQGSMKLISRVFFQTVVCVKGLDKDSVNTKGLQCLFQHCWLFTLSPSWSNRTRQCFISLADLPL